MAKAERLWNPKPHRAVDFNEKAVDKAVAAGLAVGVKVDGYRALISMDEYDTLRITTREGILFQCLHNSDHWVDAITKQLRVEGLIRADWTLDVEMWIAGVPFDEQGGTFRSHAPLQYITPLRLTVLDFAPTSAYMGEPYLVPYHQRRKEFDHLSCVAHRPDHFLTKDFVQDCINPGKIQAIYDVVRDAGFEGLVLKDCAQEFRCGKVQGWWKLKPEIEEDGKIVGFVPGEEGKANTGKIVGFVVELENGQTANAVGLYSGHD